MMKCGQCGGPATRSEERFPGTEYRFDENWCNKCWKEEVKDCTEQVFVVLLPEIRNLLAEISTKLDKLL